MRQSQLLIPTLKETPADADVTSHQLMVRIVQQPADPNERCAVVGAATGTYEGEPITVEISCANPLRVWWFHNQETLETRTPENEEGLPLPVIPQPDGTLGRFGELTHGGVDDKHIHPYKVIIPPQAAAGLQDQPLFKDILNHRNSEGVVHSNLSGRTYWIATESGPGDIKGSKSTAVGLDTVWDLRKNSDNARFQLTLRHVNILGFLDSQVPVRLEEPNPELHASAELSFEVRVRTDTGWRTTSHQGGEINLHGRFLRNPSGTFIQWRHQPVLLADHWSRIWHLADFKVTASGQGGLPGVKQVGMLELKAPKPIAMNLGGVPTGAVFSVIARARAHAYNRTTPEGGISVYLRDPAEIDNDADPAPGGFELTHFEGLTLLPASRESLDAESTPAAAPACLPDQQPDVLEFAADAFRVFESNSNTTGDNVRVVRGGVHADRVRATVRAYADTAADGQDYQATDRAVTFDDDAPERLVHFFVLDDALEEPDETFTVSLEDPEGCAVIGAQQTAVVTIVQSDTVEGTLAFAADSFAANEADGEVTLTVVRQDSTTNYGELTAEVSTADGDALDGTHYQGVVQQVVFADGDATPQTVAVPIIDDNDDNADRRFTARLTGTAEHPAAQPDTAEVVIRDDDAPRLVGFTAAAFAASEPDGVVTVTLDRTGDLSETAQVRVTSEPGTAGSDDFAPVDELVDFAVGTAMATLDVGIVDDQDAEGEESFSLRLTDPVGAALGVTSETQIVIADDESVITVPPDVPVLAVTPDSGQLRFTWPRIENTTRFRLLQSNDTGAPVVVADNIAGVDTALAVDPPLHLSDWNTVSYRLEACNAVGCTNSNAIGVADLVTGLIEFVKASNPDGVQQEGNGDKFGWALALSADGRTLAVGAPDEDGSAVGVNGDDSDNDAGDAGAVYVFSRSGDTWTQQAYVKAPNTQLDQAFGESLALDASGDVLAVGAPREGSRAQGVDGDWHYDSFNIVNQSGAVYVYQRDTADWALAHYIKASNAGESDYFGTAVDLSHDGRTLAIGAPGEAAAADAGDPADDSAADTGTAYVLNHDGTTWIETAYLKAQHGETGDRFGSVVALAADGASLAVAALGEDSGATGVDADPTDNSLPGNGSRFTGTGAVYVYAHDNGVWQQDAYLKPSAIDADDLFGAALAISDDGHTLAVGAPREDSAGTGMNAGTDADNSASNAGAVFVFERESGSWQQTHYVKASNTRRANYFGTGLALSADGAVLVIGANGEGSFATAIDGDQSQGTSEVGAAYVLERQTGGFAQTRYVKPSNSDQPLLGDYGRRLWFGRAVALSGDGEVLAAGAPDDGSNAPGLNGDQANEDARNSGAVFVY